MSAFPNTQPLFRSLAAQLRARITAGEWTPGDRLPPETALAGAHAVGVNTVRRALALLAAEGLVVRRQGAGTYVAARARRRIGVIVPSLDYYFPAVVAGVAEVAASAGATLRVTSSAYDDAVEIRRIREAIADGCDGLLLTPTLHRADPSARLDLLRALPVPVVLMERLPTGAPPDDTLSAVCTDVVAGGYAAVRHLAAAGRRRIGFLGRRDTATSAAAWRGFQRGIDDLGLTDVADGTERRSSWDTPALAAYARRVRELALDAVVCLGDREAIALLPHLHGVGLSVPEDVALVSHDDEEAAHAPVPLTAVSPPKREIGRLAASTLLARLDGGGRPAPVRMLLQPEVRRRSSSRARSTLSAHFMQPLASLPTPS
ncbi:GntR family transcriptional regulator [Microbacterium sp. K36]|uniref:GntR family transcriptional regulator n=1 Tax=Microbacterium sp. K36 TaxID=2305439 RepID=UPI00109D3C0A|nr:GntR family transcriptional regulator [Microbacterium sp. K36]